MWLHSDVCTLCGIPCLCSVCVFKFVWMWICEGHDIRVKDDICEIRWNETGCHGNWECHVWIALVTIDLWKNVFCVSYELKLLKFFKIQRVRTLCEVWAETWEAVDNCVLLCHYAACSSNFLPTFPDKGLVSSCLLDSSLLKMGPIGCPETSVID